MNISHEEDDFSSFGPLPDEVVLQILNKLMDLKTLRPCKFLSKRFNRIILQVNTISFTSKPDMFLLSFLTTIHSLKKFGGLKSLYIQIPPAHDYPFLFKWKLKFGNKLDSLVFLSPSSIYQNRALYVEANGHEQEDEEEEDMELERLKHRKAKSCMTNGIVRHYMLLKCIENIPLLEEVSIKDTNNRCRISASGRKIAEMRKNLTSGYESVRQNRARKCYVPLLELPVSGYVMKGVTLFLMERNYLPDDKNDTFVKTDDDFEDKEEAAFSEAVIEIFKKHRARFVRLDDFTSFVFL